jgi:Domain of unknown function (DUF1937)
MPNSLRRPYIPKKPDPNDEFEVEFTKVKGLDKLQKLFEEELDQSGELDKLIAEIEATEERERRMKVADNRTTALTSISTEFHKTPSEVIGAPGYWYVATPYTKYHHGRDWAHEHACRALANLWAAGAPAFSPIAHTHSTGAFNFHHASKWEHEAWMTIDEPMMRAAHGLIVVMLDGWSSSKGVMEEIEFFQKRGRPIWYVTPRNWVWSKKV